MCFFGGGKDEPDPVVPDSPAEVLTQEAPTKKTENEGADKDSAGKKNPLAIGSKKYATPKSVASQGYPSVQQ